MGKIYCKQNRSFEGKIKTTTVSLNPDGKYFVSILVDNDQELPDTSIMLKYKSEWEGKTYLEIDRWFPSSKTCNVCLNKVDSLSLEVRNWTCSKCNKIKFLQHILTAATPSINVFGDRTGQ